MINNKHHNALKDKTLLDNKYEIIKELGSGSFGITYLAYLKKLNIQVVIKEYFPNELATRDNQSTIVPINTSSSEFYDKGKERFLFEAQVIAKFKHPYITRVIDYFETNNTAYFVMEYEEGIDLGDWLKTHKNLTQEDILPIIIPILDALTEIHKHNIYHRDIKPDNLYIRKDGAPMLIDFGAAKESYQEGSRASSFNPQTAGYAALEQISSVSKYIGPHTDLYAIGAVLHKIVTGKTPPVAGDRSLSQNNEGIDPYESLANKKTKGYSTEFLEAIDWALQLYAKDRPQNAKELQKALMQRKKIEKSVEEKKLEKLEDVIKTVKPAIKDKQKIQRKIMPIILVVIVLVIGIVFYQIDKNNIEIERQKSIQSDAFTYPDLRQLNKKGDPKRGKELIAGSGACVACHSINSENLQPPMDSITAVASYGVNPPDLSNAGAVYDAKFLAALIKNPAHALMLEHKFNYQSGKFHPMVSFYGSDQEVADMVAYLQFIAPMKENLSAEMTFETACGRCHSVNFRKWTQIGKRSDAKDKVSFNEKLEEYQKDLTIYLGVLPPDLSEYISMNRKNTISEIVNNPQSILKGTSMPRVGVTRSSMKKIINYLDKDI